MTDWKLIKTNNCPDNLEWVTAAENNRHAFATGLNKGFGHLSRLTPADVRRIRELGDAGWHPNRIADLFSISRSYVHDILIGRRLADVA